MWRGIEAIGEAGFDASGLVGKWQRMATLCAAWMLAADASHTRKQLVYFLAGLLFGLRHL